MRSFSDLSATPFTNGVNAFCWPRTLPGDFGEIVEKLGAGEGIVPVEEALLRSLAVSRAGEEAREVLLEDQRLLRERGLAPELNCIHFYPRDSPDALVPTDVYSFHADRAPVPAETWLCTYFGAPSEGLRNDQAQRCIDQPGTRARLLREFGGADDEAFDEFLAEQSYDLHFTALPEAAQFSFGVGHLWRIALEHPGCPVPPCLHRAPATMAGEPPRLLLIC